MQMCCWRADTTAALGRVSASNFTQSLKPLLKKTRITSFLEALASFRASGQLVLHLTSWGASDSASSPIRASLPMLPPSLESTGIAVSRPPQPDRRPREGGRDPERDRPLYQRKGRARTEMGRIAPQAGPAGGEWGARVAKCP